MITVQPIQAGEIDQFISVGNTSGHSNEIKQYLEHLLSVGAVRTEWCYLVKEEARLLGRIAYWTLPKAETPQAMVLLELPWESCDYLNIGSTLMRKTLSDMAQLGAKTIEYVLDQPVMAPQWQNDPEKRIAFLEHMGFQLNRETFRFEWKSSQIAPVNDQRLTFKTLNETGNSAFIEAVERVSSGILDRREQHDREVSGAHQHAYNLFAYLQQMEYHPDWWQLAYTDSGELVGLVMPTKSPTYATIAYIGVVPEKRGCGYIDLLLQQGTSILSQAGIQAIRADTDLQNIPMANAFKRVGYTQFATRREYSLDVASLFY